MSDSMTNSTEHSTEQSADSGMDLRVDPIEWFPIPYGEISADGTVLCVNTTACQVMQRSCASVAGHKIWEFEAPDQMRQSEKEFFAWMSLDEEMSAIRRSFCSESGQIRTFEVYRRKVRDMEGTPIGVRFAMIDITEGIVAHAEAHQSRVWLENVLASVAEAVVVTDALGFIRYLNPAAEQLTGWTALELSGRVIEKAFPLLSYEPIEGGPISHRAALESRCRGRARVLHRGSEPRLVEISTAPVVDKENGWTVGVVTVVRPEAEVPA